MGFTRRRKNKEYLVDSEATKDIETGCSEVDLRDVTAEEQDQIKGAVGAVSAPKVNPIAGGPKRDVEWGDCGSVLRQGTDCNLQVLKMLFPLCAAGVLFCYALVMYTQKSGA